ncbi:FtsX-like permease family protein [Micromonospora rhizosphaerae]|uniref:FtsX-like permease family protein n=1 Tax=Micromonospora rhizosphaerae TaxID=568872 RepID=A0A1C6R842_9ACTN|nr:FtsX-like permease family protein [Micromonospora rhizosphaerae]SCL13227.1 FtsX-like permease family protein [Micromonospora rhizosphaerae]
MVGFIWRQLRGRAGRSLALLVGALVATTSFIVLTSTTTASRLQVIGAVESNSAAAYDILVRPKGSRTAQEVSRGLVQPNYLSGLFGGITMAQYQQVAATNGVSVAAPIAMLGYSTRVVPVEVDVTAAVDRNAESQVIRIDPTFAAERGLSRAAARPHYAYVTRNEVVYPDFGAEPDSGPVRHSNGRSYPAGQCNGAFGVPLEVLPNGRAEPICGPPEVSGEAGTTHSDLDESAFRAVRLLDDGRFEVMGVVRGGQGPERVTKVVDRLMVSIAWYVPFLVAAVDPPAEERLVGLTGAVVEGRTLRTDDLPVDLPGLQNRQFPVLVTTRPYVDGTVSVSLSRLRPDRVAGLSGAAVTRALERADRIAAGSARLDVEAAHRAQMTAEVQGGDDCCYAALWPLVQAGQTGYDELPDGVLRARTVDPDPGAYALPNEATAVPWLSADVSFRPLRQLEVRDTAATRYPGWRPVGIFDPERLAAFGDLSRVPLETYEPPTAEGADARSRAALGGQPLLPSGNPGGYLGTPPFLLTNLASLPKLLEDATGPQRAAPISAIRVRVADVDGYSERSAERVRLVAEQIADATGLDVDITLGSSPAPQTVELPAGSFGRPALRLAENWSALGVASVIVQAVDRKSVLLFLLVLVVCALFLGNAVSAAVRDRRSELALLACLGWPARRISLLILGEVAALGLAAGLLSLALATPTSAALGIDVGWRRAVLAVPVALLLALVAGLAPALRASRAHPAAALRPPVAAARRAGRPRTLLRLALTNLARTPGRSLLGAGALAIGVAALTLVGAVSYAFRGAVVGSLLGDAISLSVRGPDVVAAAATVLLGTAAVADVLYLGIRDRAAELATLRAIGWTDPALSRLIGYEGLALGVLGGVTGALLGLLGTVGLIGSLPGSLLLVAIVTAAAGIVVSCLAALLPATLLRRLPTARLLAEE